MMYKNQPTHQTVFTFICALFLSLGTACNSTPDKDKDPDQNTPNENNGNVTVVEAVPIKEKKNKKTINSNLYQQRLESLGSLEGFDCSSANNYEDILVKARKYLNDKFNDKSEKIIQSGQIRSITKKSLNSISSELFKDGSLLRHATDMAIAGYTFPFRFWKYKFWKEHDRASKNGAIVHFIISVIAVRYEAERLIKEGTLTEEAVKNLKKKLLLEKKISYDIQAKGLGLLSSDHGNGKGKLKKSKKLMNAVKMMEEALDTLLQKEKDTTN